MMDYDGWDCEGHDLILGRHGDEDEHIARGKGDRHSP